MTKSFEDWFNQQGWMEGYSHHYEGAYETGAQSRQDEVDKLGHKIAVYEKHIEFLKSIHENEFNEGTDLSYVLGMLDGFFECIESDLKEETK